MHLLPSLFVAAALSAVVPAQITLDPAAWQHNGVSFFRVAASGQLHFEPTSPVRKFFNVWQDVKVPPSASGDYMVIARGWGGSTGSFNYSISIGSTASAVQGSYLYAFANVTARMAGTVRVSFNTDSSDTRGDAWDLWLELIPVAGPVPEIYTKGDDPLQELIIQHPRLRAVAISLTLEPVPIQIPGLSGALHLSHSMMEVLTLTMQEKAAYLVMAYPLNVPPFWVQALDDKGFGSPIPITLLR